MPYPPPPPGYKPERAGPLLSAYQSLLNQIGSAVGTVLATFWTRGGAALAAGAFVYFLAFAVIHPFLQRLGFDLAAFVIGCLTALAVLLLYCLPEQLRRVDAAHSKSLQGGDPNQQA